MIIFARYVLLLTSLLCFVSALPLAERDVVDPPITNPKAGTVWQVGQTETVTWNNTGLPVNETNPVGMLILGIMSSNSENLMLNAPLATNINYATGQVQITVPNVPSGSSYIVVLFGDSGNASPEFTIINGASSVTPSPTTTGSSPAGSTPTSSSPSPSSSSNNGGGGSSPSSGGGASNTGSGSTATAPSSSSTTSLTSTVVVTASSTPSSTNSNAAWQKQAPRLWTCLSVSLALIYFAFS